MKVGLGRQCYGSSSPCTNYSNVHYMHADVKEKYVHTELKYQCPNNSTKIREKK